MTLVATESLIRRWRHQQHVAIDLKENALGDAAYQHAGLSRFAVPSDDDQVWIEKVALSSHHDWNMTVLHDRMRGPHFGESHKKFGHLPATLVENGRRMNFWMFS